MTWAVASKTLAPSESSFIPEMVSRTALTTYGGTRVWAEMGKLL